ncbi:MAG: hypothetical protein Q4F00_10295 [bacterium]|nr:hypothetical protein [bacterium]
MMIHKFKLTLFTMMLAGTLSLQAYAGINASNEDGDYDGRYTIVLEDNKTKECSEPLEATLEGNFLTVKHPDGDITYKISDLYDRRTELEGSIYNNKTKSYMTVHMDDHSHIFHKDKQVKESSKKTKKSSKKKRKPSVSVPSSPADSHTEGQL